MIALNPEDAPANTLGIRRIMFAVEGIEDVVARLHTHGAEPRVNDEPELLPRVPVGHLQRERACHCVGRAVIYGDEPAASRLSSGVVSAVPRNMLSDQLIQFRQRFRGLLGICLPDAG